MSETTHTIPGQRPGKAKQSLRVLIVDPNPETRSLLKAALRSLEDVGSVGETSTPLNLMSILGKTQVDVVILEQELGQENPYALVRDAKANPTTSQANFVLMSSNLDMDMRRKGMEVGIQGYLPKPFDVKSLESALRDAMGKVSTNHKETLNKVRKINFFSDFADLELVKLLKICHTRKYNDGEFVFREGEMGDRMYVVVAGTVEILKQRETGVEVLTTMNPGDVFGEMAIVDAEPRSADARARGESLVLELNAQILSDINDILALKLFRKIAILVTKKLRLYTN